MTRMRWLTLPCAWPAPLAVREPAWRQLRMRRAFRVVRALSPVQRERLRALWRDMSPEQRRDWLERGGPGITPP